MRIVKKPSEKISAESDIFTQNELSQVLDKSKKTYEIYITLDITDFMSLLLVLIF